MTTHWEEREPAASPAEVLTMIDGVCEGLRKPPERELEGVRAKDGPKEFPVPFFSVE